MERTINFSLLATEITDYLDDHEFEFVIVGINGCKYLFAPNSKLSKLRGATLMGRNISSTGYDMVTDWGYRELRLSYHSTSIVDALSHADVISNLPYHQWWEIEEGEEGKVVEEIKYLQHPVCLSMRVIN